MNKEKLITYSEKSKLMDITITYGDETFRFNLNSEVIVNENKINDEIKNQPSAYAFLGMLHKKLIRKAQDVKREMEKVYSHMFILYKETTDEHTGRPLANDLAKEKAMNSVKYQKVLKNYIEAQHQADIIEVCVRAFEQRQSLLQTLSANIRKTN